MMAVVNMIHRGFHIAMVFTYCVLFYDSPEPYTGAYALMLYFLGDVCCLFLVHRVQHRIGGQSTLILGALFMFI